MKFQHYFKYILLFIVITMSEVSFAAKIIGYELDVRNVKNGTGGPTDAHIFRLKLYSDNVAPSLTNTSVVGTIRDNVGNTIASITMNKISSAGYSINYPATNCDANDQSHTEILVFESASINTINYNAISGYYMSFNLCCKSDSLRNLPVITSRNFTAILEFPTIGSTSARRYNSSPYFVNLPLTRFCLNRAARTTWSAYDIDGDSLSYSLVSPLNNDNIKPFTEYAYASGYSISNRIGGKYPISINAKTGELNFFPTKLGRHVIAVLVSEYRAGVKIGELRREIDINVVNDCPTDYFPEITSTSIKNGLVMDSVQISKTKELIFDIEDLGATHDSIYLSIIDEMGNGVIPLSSIDTLTYKWNFYNASGALIYSARGNPTFNYKGKFKVGIELSPRVFDPIGVKFAFKMVIRDNSCYFPLADTQKVTLSYFILDSISVDPITQVVNPNSTLALFVKSKYPTNVTYRWQVNHELGFEDINNNQKYLGVTSDTLKFDVVDLSDHRTIYRCILNGRFNSDTSAIAQIILKDSCKVTILDTLNILNIDTNLTTITIQQTEFVMDTLFVPFFSNINIEQSFSNLSIHPNPTTGIITIMGLPENETYDLFIFDLLGKQVFSQKVQGTTEVDLSNLNKGVYLLRVGASISKVIKND